MSAPEPFARHPGFQSFKTRKPVHYPKRWMRTALILATLDEKVTEIIACPALPMDRPEVEFQFWVERAKRYTLVLLTDFSPRQLRLLDYGDLIACFSRAEVLNHPAEKLARQVWKHSRVNIDPAIQVSIMDHINSSPKEEVTLIDLLMLGWNIQEVTRQVMAMVAGGILRIDTTGPLRLTTAFKVGRDRRLSILAPNHANQFTAQLNRLLIIERSEVSNEYEKIATWIQSKDPDDQ